MPQSPLPDLGRQSPWPFPPTLHGWRRTPAGAQGFVVGTRFGHGPFSFFVEQWDGRTLRARIETRGFVGHRGFALKSEGERVVVTHDLDARLTLPNSRAASFYVAR